MSRFRLSKASYHLWMSRRHIFSTRDIDRVPTVLSEDRLRALAYPIRGEARSVADAVKDARVATAVAGEEGSDDVERGDAVQLTKIALKRYVRLVKNGNPPIQLSENASRICAGPDEKASIEEKSNTVAGTQSRIELRAPEARNDVMHLLGDEVQAMKQDLFMSNRQRVWIGWRGWF